MGGLQARRWANQIRLMAHCAATSTKTTAPHAADPGRATHRPKRAGVFRADQPQAASDVLLLKSGMCCVSHRGQRILSELVQEAKSASAAPAFRQSRQLLAPPNLTAAVKEAAEREMTTTSEFVRRLVIKELRSNGIDPCEFAPAPASKPACAPAMA
jgi:hypothetical protein